MIHNNTKYWAFTWSRNIKQHQQWLTAEEKSAINYFHGTGFYAKLQDPKTPPNLFDTRKTKKKWKIEICVKSF